MALASKMIRELLENGVHFGHQTNKWNPKMEKFIFGEKSGIYIIDLTKTEESLLKAADFLYEITSSGKTVLFAGTKKQAKKIIRDEAERCGMFFIDERWLGGCLTNFATIRRSVDKLNQLQEMKAGEVYESLAKKEKARLDRVEAKLLKNLEGIRDMNALPDCLVVVDPEDENIAVKEAYKIGIPIIALIDTNSDPDMIDFPIPGNDDAIRSITYIVSTLADAAEKGRLEFTGGKPVKKAAPAEEEKSEETVEKKKMSLAQEWQEEVGPPVEEKDKSVEPAVEEDEKAEVVEEVVPAEEVKTEETKIDVDVEGDISLDDNEGKN